jgi:hypothetical protein
VPTTGPPLLTVTDTVYHAKAVMMTIDVFPSIG